MGIKSNSTMGFQVYLEISETEAQALHAITRYGNKSFLEIFYKHLGKTDLESHEKGLISLFDTIKAELPAHLERIELTRKTFKEHNPNK